MVVKVSAVSESCELAIEPPESIFMSESWTRSSKRRVDLLGCGVEEKPGFWERRGLATEWELLNTSDVMSTPWNEAPNMDPF